MSERVNTEQRLTAELAEVEKRAECFQVGRIAAADLRVALGWAEQLRALREALSDLIDVAESRVPGDEALWSERVKEARAVLS